MNMQRKPSARLLLADDHRLLADACRSLLEPEYQVVGVETDGRSLVKSAITLKPDLVILDIAMPHLNGLDAAQQIKQKLPSVKLVFMTMNQAPEVAAEAFRRTLELAPVTVKTYPSGTYTSGIRESDRKSVV